MPNPNHESSAQNAAPQTSPYSRFYTLWNSLHTMGAREDMVGVIAPTEDGAEYALLRATIAGKPTTKGAQALSIECIIGGQEVIHVKTTDIAANQYAQHILSKLAVLESLLPTTR